MVFFAGEGRHHDDNDTPFEERMDFEDEEDYDDYDEEDDEE